MLRTLELVLFSAAAAILGANNAVQMCYRSYTNGVLYRGTESRAKYFSKSEMCQKWTDTKPNAHSYAAGDYPGLGDHNYCRNPDVNGSRTRPWCYYNGTQGWGYCDDVQRCSNQTCYSVIDKGGSYSGYQDRVTVNGKQYQCLSWKDAFKNVNFSGWSGLQHAVGIIAPSNGSYCRNPNFVYKTPWCYYKAPSPKRSMGDTIKNATCNVPRCIGDVGNVPKTCGGTGDGKACVFPFKYKGFTFINCTSYERGALWCATLTTSDGVVARWGHCNCGTPTISTWPTATQSSVSTTRKLPTTQWLPTRSATTHASSPTSAQSSVSTTRKLPTNQWLLKTHASSPTSAQSSVSATRKSPPTTQWLSTRSATTHASSPTSAQSSVSTTRKLPTTQWLLKTHASSPTSAQSSVSATRKSPPTTQWLSTTTHASSPTTTPSSIISTTRKSLPTRSATTDASSTPSSRGSITQGTTTAQTSPTRRFTTYQLTTQRPTGQHKTATLRLQVSTQSTQAASTAHSTTLVPVENDSNSALPVAVGSGCGGLVVLILVVAAIMYRWRKRSSASSNKFDASDLDANPYYGRDLRPVNLQPLPPRGRNEEAEYSYVEVEKFQSKQQSSSDLDRPGIKRGEIDRDFGTQASLYSTLHENDEALKEKENPSTAIEKDSSFYDTLCHDETSSTACQNALYNVIRRDEAVSKRPDEEYDHIETSNRLGVLARGVTLLVRRQHL
ncbi:uncharacterized protein [Oscarella lobularis]|uniref:uncharacterized protein n=1 Tax=Oscarella lobularis TaxID=121494 RepID=UPI0033143258